MSEPAWRVQGESPDGPYRCPVTFAIGIKRDGTGWIIAEPEYPVDSVEMELSGHQLHGLRSALANLLGGAYPDGYVHVVFESKDDDRVCHATEPTHTLGERLECWNCSNARLLARHIGDPDYEMREQHVPRVSHD